jgi:hypothetical protein
VFYNARQYSVVKDLDCFSNQYVPSRTYSLLTPTACFSLGVGLLELVGPDGIEPSTSPLSGVRSSHLSYGPRCVTSSALHTAVFCPTSGGAGRDRTGDLLSANQALSQLSYSPFSSPAPPVQMTPPFELFNRGQLDTGTKSLEPSATFRLTSRTLSGVPVACSSSVSRIAPEFQ